MRRHRSRLLRREERRSKKSLFFAILGSIILIFGIFKLGIPALAQFSLFLTNLTPPQEVKNIDSAFIQAPILDPLPIATNSATVKLTGIATSDKDVEVLVNQDLVNKIKADKDGEFEIFNLKLRNGENIITARVKDGDNSSELSNPVTITYDNNPPTLQVTSPNDNASFSKSDDRIQVKGKTETNSYVTVNDSRAVVDGSGDFSFILGLSAGENKIVVRATDLAGNETSIERRVTYSP